MTMNKKPVIKRAQYHILHKADFIVANVAQVINVAYGPRLYAPKHLGVMSLYIYGYE